jgi:hypothetical protein
MSASLPCYYLMSAGREGTSGGVWGGLHSVDNRASLPVGRDKG